MGKSVIKVLENNKKLNSLTQLTIKHWNRLVRKSLKFLKLTVKRAIYADSSCTKAILITHFSCWALKATHSDSYQPKQTGTNCHKQWTLRATFDTPITRDNNDRRRLHNNIYRLT